MYRVMTQHFTS